ncbi:MAG: hypothetical protein K2X03_13840 [Bryobacteraceae bacterium]|nr:hypothetical protein [Bryobacteraceae bacterium]
MPTQTIRQSTILIASGKRTRVYASLDQVPSPLKQRLMASTSGANSATILLADRAGREEIVRAMRGMPSHVQARIAAQKLPWTEAFARKHALERARLPARPCLPAAPVPKSDVLREAFSWTMQHWPELLLPAGVAVGLWALLAA